MALLVAVLIVVAVVAAAVLFAVRPDPRVARSPVDDGEWSADAWPLSAVDEGASTPYQRGATSAAGLAGRR